MNWQQILQTLWNAALQFGGTYGAVYASGGNSKVALGAALASLATGQLGLQQTAPKDQPAATK